MHISYRYLIKQLRYKCRLRSLTQKVYYNLISFTWAAWVQVYQVDKLLITDHFKASLMLRIPLASRICTNGSYSVWITILIIQLHILWRKRKYGGIYNCRSDKKSAFGYNPLPILRELFVYFSRVGKLQSWFKNNRTLFLYR